MLHKVLLLGDPLLRVKSSIVIFPLTKQLHQENEDLKRALEAFRKENGFGRAIAAPQIGISKRFIAMNFGEKPFSIFNPIIQWHSSNTVLLWDDCMSFPDLLVKVRRYHSISVLYQDEQGKKQVWEKLDSSRSELLQHEIDHLDGILAIDRALDCKSIIYRSEFIKNKRYYLKQIQESNTK